MRIPAFQRAREPEQKELRRQELVRAASRLLADGGMTAVSLSAIAREAGLAKSNVYRYFESREEILLEILVADEVAWVGELERAFAPLAGRGDVDAVARRIASTIARRPITCELIAVVANVLEHNIGPEAVLAFKTRVLELSIRLGNALHAALPQLPHDQTPGFLRCLHALVAGLWPMAHPAPLMAEVLQRRELRTLACDFEGDLRGGVTAMLRGLVAG